ncbi:MAG: 3-oxoacyl-ACP synthase [Anaerolineaceae bacterium]|nr:3-oxoacyl-ACP synthase [Anaerolineaceae bacterium]
MTETSVGIIGIGTYFPPTVEGAADLVERTQIPADILHQKMGIRQRHIAGEGDTVSYMATEAAKKAIAQAGIDPAEIDMVISHGSEYKDHVVWNAAGKIQQDVGAVNAFAFETYALCAGAPIAINVARSMMIADPSLKTVLLAAGSRENDLVNLSNPRVRFMYNFGAGGGAMILRRGHDKNLVLGASAITDGSLSETVMLTTDDDALNGDPVKGDYYGMLDVRNLDYMSERLGETSMENFLKVMRTAVEKSGYKLDDVAFLGITHMKRSFYNELVAAIGLTPEQSVYLEDYGHVQSVDQVLTLELGLAQGKIKSGDLVLLTGAGTGYTWSSIAVRWG